jgi:acyl carrier protein
MGVPTLNSHADANQNARLLARKPSILKKLNESNKVATEGITPMSVEQELGVILGKWTKNDTASLAPSTKLGELNIDSLDLVEVMFEIEEKFDISLMQSHQDAREASLADLAGWIEQQLALRQSGAAALKPTIQPAKASSRIKEDELESAPLPQ